jgi:glutathione synthase
MVEAHSLACASGSSSVSISWREALMQVSVFSPGGLGSCGELYGVDFTTVVIDALDHKVQLRDHYGGTLTNVILATL